MGEGTQGVKASPADIERDIEAIRGHMEEVVAELDDRRHRLTNWGRQLRQKGPVVLRVAAVVGAVAGTVVLVRRMRYRRAHGRNGQSRPFDPARF